MHRWMVPVAACFVVILLWGGSAQAYPWMIRHGYTGCAPCHLDPSGGGLLTEYGRAQAELFLQTNYPPRKDDQDVGRSTGFLWGAVHPPEWLLLGGYVREAELATKLPGRSLDHKLIQMQYDLNGGVREGIFRAAASIGYLPQGGLPAAITTSQRHNVVSREHWAGVALDDDRLLLRAGRINLPFGVRSIEHTLWVRTSTRTDINDTQQHGAALGWNGDWTRGEIMAVAGNYQINPNDVRERGYSGYLEHAFSLRTALGISSMVTHAKRDRLLGVELTRQAHGVFARLSPVEPLALMAEADLLIQNPNGSQTGYAAYAQADAEAIQGVHVVSTTELMNSGSKGEGMSYGGWLSILWFFAPHADVRLDAIGQRFDLGGPPLTVLTCLGQLHMYL